MPFTVRRRFTRQQSSRISSLILGAPSRGSAQTSGAEQLPKTARDILNVLAQQDGVSPTGAFAMTAAYVVQFYPLWFTYNQTGVAIGWALPTT
jgi:hypothetical protein